MKQKYKSIKVVLILLVLLTLSGCNDSIIINDFNVDSKLYNEQQYFMPKQVVKFSVDIQNNNSGELNYKWTANGGQFLEQGKAEVNYKTPNIPGDYNLFLTVSNNSGEQINHQFSFTVKGNYPDKVSLLNVSTTSVNSGIKIDWTEYPKDDFYTYKILRSNNHFIGADAEVVASINNQKRSSYIDYDIKAKEVYSYQVMVINNDGYLSVSNEKMIKTLPEQIKKIDLPEELSDLVVSSTKSKLYINSSDQKNLLVVDLDSYQIETKLDLDIKVEKMLVDQKNDFLFMLGANNTLLRVNLSDYSQTKFDFKTKLKDISLTEDYLYLATTGEYNLIKFNIKENKIVDKFAVAADNNLINPSQIDNLAGQYLFIDKVFGGSLIYQLENLTKPIANFDIGIVKKSIFSKLGKQNYLYVANTHHPLQVYSEVDPGEFSLKNKFEEISTPVDFAIDHQQKRIFAAVDKTIYIYSLEGDELLDKIKLPSYINRLAWNQKQKELYLLTSKINGENYNLMIANFN